MTHSRSRDVLLMGRIARRHYVHDQSKSQIAHDLGMSRFKVARLLEQARDIGLVRIAILPVDGLDVDLSARLEEDLGLRRCVVVLAPDPAPDAGSAAQVTTTQLADAAAELLEELLTPDDVLGLPWSRTIHATVDALRALPPVEVVQLCGDQTVPGSYASAVEVATRAARLAGGRAHVFFAPLVLDEPSAAVAVRRQPAVRAALEAARRVSLAFVGLGAWAPGLSSIHDAVTPADRDAVARCGAVGEIAGVFFDADGRLLDTPLSARVVALSGTDLAAIGHVVAIASGAGKADAVRAAVRGGLVDGLVVDTPLALALAAGADGGASR